MSIITHIEGRVSAEEVFDRVREMALAVRDDYADKNLLLLGLLTGGVDATVLLGKALYAEGVDVPVDFMRVESYGLGHESNGSPRITADTKNSVAGFDVLVVDDVRDKGWSLAAVLGLLESKGALSVEALTLVEKEGTAETGVSPKYVGFTMPAEYFVGSGLDEAEQHRFYPGIGAVVED